MTTVDYTLVRRALLAEHQKHHCQRCGHLKVYHNEHGCRVGADDDVTQTCSCTADDQRRQDA